VGDGLRRIAAAAFNVAEKLLHPAALRDQRPGLIGLLESAVEVLLANRKNRKVGPGSSFSGGNLRGLR
jgi:hypothetical protein